MDSKYIISQNFYIRKKKKFMYTSSHISFYSWFNAKEIMWLGFLGNSIYNLNLFSIIVLYYRFRPKNIAKGKLIDIVLIID